VWFWAVVVIATSIYTFVALVLDARIPSTLNMRYGERYRASLRGWSTSLGFFALGNFVGVSILYQLHGHLVDRELEPLLFNWPIELLDLLALFVIALLLSLLSALVPARVRLPWMGVGIFLFLVGIARYGIRYQTMICEPARRSAFKQVKEWMQHDR
jgi:hypothetical protein